MDKEIIEERVWLGLFEPAWGPYRNAHFLVSKKNEKYCFFISAVSTNWHTPEDARIPPNVEELSQALAGLPISSLIDFHFGDNQKRLHEDTRNYTAFQTMQGLYRSTRLVQGDTNSVSAFVRVSQKVLNAHLGSIAEIFIEDVTVKGPKSRYGEEEVEGLAGVRRFAMEHLQNLDNVLADVERAGATVCGEKSDWCWNWVKIVRLVCGEAGRWLQASKVDKVRNWPWYENRIECTAFLALCTYYRIWIPEYPIVAGPLCRIFWNDVEYQWETEEKKAMAILKEGLCTATALKMLDISDGAGQIVVGVDASLVEWGVILQQEDENKDRHPYRYETGLWNNAEQRHDSGKRECCRLMKAVEMFRNHVCGVRFVVETDANTLVQQLNLPANELPGELLTHWIMWMRAFDFDVQYIPGRLNGGPDVLSWRPRGDGEPEPEEEDDQEETIEASLRGIQVEQGPHRKRWERPYEPFVGLRLAEEYNGRWKNIGECLGNLKRPEGNNMKEMQPFRLETTKTMFQMECSTGGEKPMDRRQWCY